MVHPNLFDATSAAQTASMKDASVPDLVERMSEPALASS